MISPRTECRTAAETVSTALHSRLATAVALLHRHRLGGAHAAINKCRGRRNGALPLGGGDKGLHDGARNLHAGSVFAASPVKAMAWQRQPPKSISARGQLRHGSFIQLVPRYFWKACPLSQMSARRFSLTLSNSRPGIDFGSVARQHAALRRYVHDTAAPAAHARLRRLCVVVRNDEVEHQDALETLFRFLDDLGALQDLGARRHQAGSVLEAQA